MRELYSEFVVWQQRQRDEHNHRMSLAWHIAAMTRGTKGLPKLERLLAKEHKPQSREAHRLALTQLSQQYRIPLRVRKENG